MHGWTLLKVLSHNLSSSFVNAEFWCHFLPNTSRNISTGQNYSRSLAKWHEHLRKNCSFSLNEVLGCEFSSDIIGHGFKSFIRFHPFSLVSVVSLFRGAQLGTLCFGLKQRTCTPLANTQFFLTFPLKFTVLLGLIFWINDFLWLPRPLNSIIFFFISSGSKRVRIDFLENNLFFSGLERRVLLGENSG